jgi:radical SAM protein with 4Fe4S-binding SPASM domain
MTDDLYEKILLNAAELKVKKIIPMGFGEPFMDPQFMERVKLITKILPEAKIEIYTNGSLIDDSDIRELAGIKNLLLKISLNAASQETRKHIMGLNDFDRVCGTIEKVKEAGIDLRLTMVFFPSITMEEASTFMTYHRPWVLMFQSFGGLTYRYRRTNPTSCCRIKEGLFIRYNGDVPLCCFDPTGRVVFGNLNDQSLEEIWQSEKHQVYLIAHANKQGQMMKLCENCAEGD